MKSLNEQSKQAAFYLIVFGIICALASQLTGCGKDPQNAVVQVSTQVVNTPSDTVQSIVNDYNAWRTSNGQSNISPGLSCTLYTVPQTTTGITAVANGGIAPVLTNIGSFTYQGGFDQPSISTSTGFNVLPSALQTVYQNWFILKCTGYLVITHDDYHEFDTVSDDGSNLYVDGVLVVNNDGLHGAKSVSGVRHLQDVVHSFELDFFQGNGQQQLVVDMDNILFPSENLWH